MPKSGIALPFQADGSGRLVLVTDDSQLRKIILLNLMNLESENPFQQDLGLGGKMIFAWNNESLRAELSRRVKELFRRLQLEDRARLVRGPTFEVKAATQELEMSIGYINLELDREEELVQNFVSGPATSVSHQFEAVISGQEE